MDAGVPWAVTACRVDAGVPRVDAGVPREDAELHQALAVVVAADPEQLDRRPKLPSEALYSGGHYRTVHLVCLFTYTGRHAQFTVC